MTKEPTIEIIAAPPNGERTTSVTEIDEAELTVRILEGFIGPRPHGASARETLAHTQPETARAAHRAARSVLRYIRECIAQSQPVQ